MTDDLAALAAPCPCPVPRVDRLGSGAPVGEELTQRLPRALEGALAAVGRSRLARYEIVTGKFSPLSCSRQRLGICSSANAPTRPSTRLVPPRPARSSLPHSAIGVSAFTAGAGLAAGAAGAGTVRRAVPTDASAGLELLAPAR